MLQLNGVLNEVPYLPTHPLAHNRLYVLQVISARPNGGPNIRCLSFPPQRWWPIHESTVIYRMCELCSGLLLFLHCSTHSPKAPVQPLSLSLSLVPVTTIIIICLSSVCRWAAYATTIAPPQCAT